MKHIVIAIIFYAAAASQAQTAGLHLGSFHDKGDFNNANVGAYYKWHERTVFSVPYAPVAGIVYNSERRVSVYAAAVFEGEGFAVKSLRVKPAVTVGLITGYFVPLMPLVTPSVAFSKGNYAVRVSLIPKAYAAGAAAVHFSLEFAL